MTLMYADIRRFWQVEPMRKHLSGAIVLGLILSGLAVAQEDPHGWANAHWGMTYAQLEAKVGAHRVPTDGKSTLGIDFDLNSMAFRAYFIVDEAFGLEQVWLRPKDVDSRALPDFYDIKNNLAHKYGAPKKLSVDTAHGTIARAEWLVGTTAIELSFLDVNGGYRDDSGQWHSIGREKIFDIVYKRVGTDKL